MYQYLPLPSFSASPSSGCCARILSVRAFSPIAFLQRVTFVRLLCQDSLGSCLLPNRLPSARHHRQAVVPGFSRFVPSPQSPSFSASLSSGCCARILSVRAFSPIAFFSASPSSGCCARILSVRAFSPIAFLQRVTFVMLLCQDSLGLCLLPNRLLQRVTFVRLLCQDSLGLCLLPNRLPQGVTFVRLLRRRRRCRRTRARAATRAEGAPRTCGPALPGLGWSAVGLCGLCAGRDLGAFDDRVGGVPSVRIFAMLTPAVVKQALQAARVQAPTVAATPAGQGGDAAAEVQTAEGGETAAHAAAAGATTSTGAAAEQQAAGAGRPLTPDEVMCTTLAWRVARHLLGQPDVDPFAAPPAPLPTAAAAYMPGHRPRRSSSARSLTPPTRQRCAHWSRTRLQSSSTTTATLRKPSPYGMQSPARSRFRPSTTRSLPAGRSRTPILLPVMLEGLPGHPLHAQAHWHQKP